MHVPQITSRVRSLMCLPGTYYNNHIVCLSPPLNFVLFWLSKTRPFVPGKLLVSPQTWEAPIGIVARPNCRNGAISLSMTFPRTLFYWVQYVCSVYFPRVGGVKVKGKESEREKGKGSEREHTTVLISGNVPLISRKSQKYLCSKLLPGKLLPEQCNKNEILGTPKDHIYIYHLYHRFSQTEIFGFIFHNIVDKTIDNLWRDFCQKYFLEARA